MANIAKPNAALANWSLAPPKLNFPYAPVQNSLIQFQMTSQPNSNEAMRSLRRNQVESFHTVPGILSPILSHFPNSISRRLMNFQENKKSAASTF